LPCKDAHAGTAARLDGRGAECEHFRNTMKKPDGEPFPPDSALYPLGYAELARARDVLTEAFAEDPFYAYIAGGCGYDRKTAGFFHLFTLHYGLRHGLVYAPSPDVEGVAIWLPPGRTGVSAWKAILPGLETLRSAGLPRPADRRGLLTRLAGYGKYSEAVHHRHARFPHWYLMVLGVADAHRGRGFASSLLRPMLEYIDRFRLPCYLETHNPANPPIYGHFGFKTVEEGKLPGSEKSHWAMVRPGAK
jgi:GNAT superfamily N-acetyltransferase